MTFGDNMDALDRLIDALIVVESGGNDKAIGDQGRARGSLQIWQGALQDANQYGKTNYSHAEMHEREKARQVARNYLLRYGAAWKRQNPSKRLTPEVLARIWNGGPMGWKKDATLAYWDKVRKVLEQMGV